MMAADASETFYQTVRPHTLEDCYEKPRSAIKVYGGFMVSIPYACLLRKPEGKRLEDLGVDGRIILK
jgi:hypothetical protein